MAYQIVLSNRFSKRLTALFSHLEKNFSLDATKELVEIIDAKMTFLSHQPGMGIVSSKIPGVYKISISRSNKLYYRVKGRKVIMLDLIDTSIAPKE